MKRVLAVLLLAAPLAAQIECLPLEFGFGRVGVFLVPFPHTLDCVYTPQLEVGAICPINGGPLPSCKFVFDVSVDIAQLGPPLLGEICLGVPVFPPIACWDIILPPLRAPPAGRQGFTQNGITMFQMCGTAAEWNVNAKTAGLPINLVQVVHSCSGC